MSALEALAGRVLMIGLPEEPDEARARDRIREIDPGGLILFRRHCPSAERAAALLSAGRSVLERPALWAIDQEGGRVNRFGDWLGEMPTAAVLAERGAEPARRFGRHTGRLLHGLGFNVDFAPVVDLSPPDRPNGVGDRAWSVDPRRTAVLAGAFLDGLQTAGVAGCLKHFPGLGETFVDSHRELPRCPHDRAALEARDLIPFRELSPRAAMVMVSHAMYPALDETMPASLSSTIVRGWLRERLGYEGLIVSDDLEMGAVAPLDEDGGAAVAALSAGCDLLIYGNRDDPPRRARRAIADAARKDSDFRRRLEDAAERVERTAARWPAPSTVDAAGAADTWFAAIEGDASLRV